MAVIIHTANTACTVARGKLDVAANYSTCGEFACTVARGKLVSASNYSMHSLHCCERGSQTLLPPLRSPGIRYVLVFNMCQPCCVTLSKIITFNDSVNQP